MPSRRAHHKSHHGCRDCKRRRVKCDELQPTCSNCLRRNRHVNITQLPHLHGYMLLRLVISQQQAVQRATRKVGQSQ
ncbi:hypothetical protein BJX61DRAFT_239866 [Aspergillus egyptiacus]|nr:hypothetical protein BJX61DRAFT_239866 [Aspergillus egyptiacus]